MVLTLQAPPYISHSSFSSCNAGVILSRRPQSVASRPRARFWVWYCPHPGHSCYPFFWTSSPGYSLTQLHHLPQGMAVPPLLSISSLMTCCSFEILLQVERYRLREPLAATGYRPMPPPQDSIPGLYCNKTFEYFVSCTGKWQGASQSLNLEPPAWNLTSKHRFLGFVCKLKHLSGRLKKLSIRGQSHVTALTLTHRRWRDVSEVKGTRCSCKGSGLSS